MKTGFINGIKSTEEDSIFGKTLSLWGCHSYSEFDAASDALLDIPENIVFEEGFGAGVKAINEYKDIIWD